MPPSAVEQEVNVVFAPFGTERETGMPYPPHPTQQRVEDWVERVKAGRHGKPGIPVLYLQHGVDSGGTRAMLNPLLKCAFEHPGIRILIGRKDYNDLRLSIMETFFDVVPPILVAEKDEQEHRYLIRGKGGNATVFFRELKDVRGLGSQEFAIIYVAEAQEIDLHAYRTIKQRCRQAGYPLMVLMEGNPPTEGHWLEKIRDPQSPEFDPDFERIVLSSEENYRFMNPSYRASLESMPAAWRRRFILGETGALPSGTPVYPSFVEGVHIGDTQIILGRPIVRGWDFGLRRAACVWGQMEDSGLVQIHREWLAMETPEEQFIAGVIQRTNEWFGPMVCRDFGDPAARNRDPHGVSTLQRLQKFGIGLGYRQTTYGERIPLINRKLSEMIGGLAAIRINPICQILDEGLLGGYHYQELSEGQALMGGKELPYRDGYYEHVANAFEYLMIGLFGQGSPVSQAFVRRKNAARARMIQQHQTVAVF